MTIKHNNGRAVYQGTLTPIASLATDKANNTRAMALAIDATLSALEQGSILRELVSA